MKTKAKAGAAKREAPPAAPARRRQWWWFAGGAALALFLIFEVYAPALSGPFLFDDAYLPFQVETGFFTWPVAKVLAQQRPLLNLSFWVNGRLFGPEPESFHAVNVLLHFLNALLAWLISWRLLGLSGVAPPKQNWLAAFCALLFLFHPVQTESVAYVAGRSESLSFLFFAAAYAVFLARPVEGVSWPRVLAVLILYACAVGGKEHAAVLPALLVLTDLLAGPGAGWQVVRRNWRLYAPMLVLGAAGAVLVWRVLAGADTAGFAIKDLPWHQYFFTQWRAVWLYLRLFVLPAGLNADYYFPISRTPLDHFAIAGLLALAGALAAAWRFRKSHPLLLFGLLAFLLLLAPTSSVVPIKDPVAERRLYLPFFALALAACEFLRRWNADRAALAAALGVLLAAFGWMAHARSEVWSDAIRLWEDTVKKSPENSRAHFQLALAYYQAGRCQDSLPHYESAARIGPREHRLLVDWGLAFDCLEQYDAALAKLAEAVKIEDTGHARSLIGMVYAKQGRLEDAMRELDRAASIEPGYDMTYVYRGNVRALQGDWTRAAEDYRKALSLAPDNDAARQALANAESRLAGR